MQQQQQRQKAQVVMEASVGSIIFSIFLLIIMIIVLVIQITIIVTFILSSNRGRCVYKDEKGNCYCKYTNRKSCESIKGQYNSNLSCSDGFEAVCDALDVDNITTV
jgi:hypothetical protein